MPINFVIKNYFRMVALFTLVIIQLPVYGVSLPANGESHVDSVDLSQYFPRTVSAHRLQKPLSIDAQLSESLYDQIPINGFIQVDPDNGQLATEKTDVWIGYDDVAIYVGARCWDRQPDSIVTRLVRRDNSFNSDEFQIAIDSYHDKRTAFYFVVNPSGSIQDGTFYNDTWSSDTWDGVWERSARIDDQGWIVEVRIPYSQLRFSEQDEYEWGIGFGRIIYRHNEHSLITWYPRNVPAVVSRFATLTGIRDIDPPRRIELTPYLTSGYSRLPSQSDNPFFKGSDTQADVGMDLKLGIGSNLTVDATINPDFGQVEVDPSTINLSAYETFYEEKRPFFIEGEDIFSFGRSGPSSRYGFNISEPIFFYSRRIGRAPQHYPDTDGWVNSPGETQILGAGKISGKIASQWSIGGLTAVTNREYADVDEDSVHYTEEVEPLTTYNLWRLKREFNEGRQAVGLMGSHVQRIFDDPLLEDEYNQSALGAGIDGWVFLNTDKTWVLSGWAGLTHIEGTEDRIQNVQTNSSHYFQRPDADHLTLDTTRTSLTGHAGRIILSKETGHWLFNAAVTWIDPEFDSNDLGFTWGTDKINEHVLIGYRWTEPGDIFRHAQLQFAQSTNHEFSGVRNGQVQFFFGYFQFLNYWSIDFFTGWGPNTLSQSLLRGGPRVISPWGYFGKMGFSSDSRKDIVFGAGGHAGISGGDGWDRGIWGWMDIKVNPQVLVEISPSYSRNHAAAQYLEEVDDSLRTIFYGKRYLVAELDQNTLATDIRIDYTFTPTLTLQAYIQPYISVGNYHHYKEFDRPETFDFYVYGEDGNSTIEHVLNDSTDQYYVDPTGGLDDDEFDFGNPDYSYKALVGNAVLRWEFRPGSTLYLVWTRNGANYDHPGRYNAQRDLRDLLSAEADNHFAIKVTWWFGG